MTDVPERIWWSPANGRLDTSEPETWYTAKMPTYEYVRADLFTALEVGRDDWKQRYETLETWYDNRAKGITALEALNDDWQREHYKLEAEVKQLRLLTGWCECDTLPPRGQPCRSCSARLLRVVLNEGGEG